MIPTSLPELNEILGGGFPSHGVSLIVGAPGSGKTTLLANIVSEVLLQRNTIVAVVGEETTRAWVQLVERQLRGPQLGVQRLYSAQKAPSLVHDLDSTSLVILDGGVFTAPLLEFSTTKPVIMTSNERSSEPIESRRVDIALRLERVKNEDRVLATLVKNRYGTSGQTVYFKYDRQLGLLDQEPPARSKWDRLLAEEDLI